MSQDPKEPEEVQGEVVRVPLFGWRGVVRAYAVVDAADAEMVLAYRWHLSHGYARSGAGENVVYMHRLVLGLGRDDPRHSDHRDRDRLNNRRRNLRPVTRGQNMQNLGPRTGRTVRGVSRDADGRGWRARVVVGGKEHVRRVSTHAEAVAAAKAMRAELMTHAEV